MLLRRPQPTVPYGPHNAVCRLHPDALGLLAAVAATYIDLRLEWCCLMFGDRVDSDTVVHQIVVPRQINGWGWYDVDAVATAEAAAAASDHVLVAQLHAHPGTDVEHSTVDDNMIASHRIVSLVAPHYGALLPSATGIGVHDYQQGYWYLLTGELAWRRVRLDTEAPIPALVDLRR